MRLLFNIFRIVWRFFWTVVEIPFRLFFELDYLANKYIFPDVKGHFKRLEAEKKKQEDFVGYISFKEHRETRPTKTF